MTTQDKIKRIREKCIEVNPEINIWACENCNTVYAEYVNGCPKCGKGKVSTMQRNIHLADVLLIIKTLKDSDTYIVKEREEKILKIVDKWNLKDDDLEKQLSQCIDFLYNLINT